MKKKHFAFVLPHSINYLILDENKPKSKHSSSFDISLLKLIPLNIDIYQFVQLTSEF